MRLVSIELENFRQHRSTRIEFSPGVTGIIGKNGSGKTTVLEAISWALYGGPAVRGTNETLRWRWADGNAPAEVTLKFDLGPHTYTVTRRLESSRSSASLAIDGIPAKTGFKEVTESVTKLLGMDYQAFFTSFFTGQKELEFMRGMDGRSRAAAISRMLGYERLVRAREKANQDRLGLAREIEALERGLGDPEEIIRRKNEALGAVTDAEGDVKSAEKRAAEAAKEVGRLRPLRELSEQKAKRFADLSRLLEVSRADLSRAAERVGELTKEKVDLAEKANELNAMAPQIDEFKRAAAEYRQLAELQKHEAARADILARIAAAEERKKSLTEQAEELASAPGDSIEAEKSLLELDVKASELEKAINGEREAYSSAKARAKAEIEHIALQKSEVAQRKRTVESAGAEGKCPTCERPLAGELAKVLAGFDEQIAALESRNEVLGNTLDVLAAEPETLRKLVEERAEVERLRNGKRTLRDLAAVRSKDLEKTKCELQTNDGELARLRSKLGEIPSGFDQRRFTELFEIGERLKPVNKRGLELAEQLKRSTVVESELEREAATFARAKQDILTAEGEIKQVGFSEKEHAELVSGYEQAVGVENAANIEAERARGVLLAANAALTSAETDFKSYKSRESEVRNKRKARVELQTIAEAFDNLRNELNNRAAPELATAASEILTDLTDGRYSTLDVNEEYDAVIRDDGELKPIISGGEEDVVNLALRLAVSTMIAERAGQDLSLLILDEVFGSLDDIRRDNVVNLLQALKNRFEQIIIITHVESIHDALDNCIWVDYDEHSKTSRIRAEDALADAPVEYSLEV
jgi:exonuclease SbcC